MKRFPFFLLALPLCATVNEPLSLAWTTGYRNDRVHWHLQQGGEGTVLASERWRDVEFWQNGLTLKVIHRDLAFALWGDYATFGRGQLSQRPSHTSSFTTGWAADASSYFGYAVNLTPGRHYKVILLPLFGFSTHFERLKAVLLDQLRMTWYGFFLGGGFLFEPGNRLKFQVAYTYHWLNLRFKNSTFKVKDGSNLGQTGWVEMSYLLSCHWSLGLGAQIHYFASRVLPTNLTDQKFKLRWVPVSGWLSIARAF